MVLTITKSKLSDITLFLSKVESCSDVSLFYMDCVYPSTLSTSPTKLYNYSNINGYNLIQNNILPIETNIIYLYKSGVVSELREVLKRTGLKNIMLEVTGQLVRLQVEDNIITILIKLPNEIVLDDKFRLFESFETRVSEINDKEMWNTSTPKDIINIINGNVVKLEGYLNNHPTMVRVSKNTFPLLGIVKTNDSKAFSFNYCFKGADTDPIIVFLVYYKKINALHAVGYTDYINTEDIVDD